MVWFLTLLGCSICQHIEPAEPHTPVLCSDLYDPDRVLDVYLTIDPVEWAGLQDEYRNWRERRSDGLELKPYHPLVEFSLDGREVEDASIRLKGNPCCSWTDEKMQFVVSFDEIDPDGRFRGLRKMMFDAPPYDPSVLRERVALSYFEDAGFATSCANSAKVFINGEYYGLYTNIEPVDKEFLERQFPDAERYGSLYKWDYNRRRFEKRDNRDPGTSDLEAYLAIDDLETFDALMDEEQSVDFWAAEAMINQSDGYWAGSINFYLYKHPEEGWQFIPWDLDHAITWWRPNRNPFRRKDYHGSTPHMDLFLSDDQRRVDYVHSLARAHRHHDADALVSRLNTWAEQIRPWVDRDPHKAFTMDEFDAEVGLIGDRIMRRHGYFCRHFGIEEPGSASE